jgi:hypothetical protein
VTADEKGYLAEEQCNCPSMFHRANGRTSKTSTAAVLAVPFVRVLTIIKY